MSHIVVMGSINMDLVVRAPRHPEPGETILGSEFHTFPGGKGANQAVACARLGAGVKMVGRLGSDAFGSALLQTLARDGVDTAYIAEDERAATGVALITVVASGQNTIVVASGANALVTGEQILSATAVFDDASVLLLQLECPMAAVEQAIQLAKQHDIPVVLNPAPAQRLGREFLTHIDYLIPNESELALLAGSGSSTALEVAARGLQNEGVKRLIVTLGEKGVFVLEAGRKTYLKAHRVPVVDTTAAGDAFVGAFAVALTAQHSTIEAAQWGNAAGALAVTRMGAQPSLPARAELDAFLAEGS
ncbi:MAG TPA: ribokinase [Anaerolineales bacterium]|jgi:ribokinase|nr:ribokinase [Anaerolineales bacterium]